MESRRLFLAVLLSMAVLVVWQFLVGPAAPPPRPTEAPPESAGPPEIAGPPETAEPPSPEVEDTAGAPAGPPAGTVTAREGEEPMAPPPLAATLERTFVLETDRVRAELTNRGAQLVSFLLKEHYGRRVGEPLDLVRARVDGPYPFALSRRNPEGSWQPHPLDEVLFVGEQIASATGAPGVRFRYVGPEGEATKEFFFEPYPKAEIEDLLRVDVTVRGERDWGLLLGPGLRNETAEERAADRTASRSGVYNLNGELERLDASRTGEPTPVEDGVVSWVGLDDKYFLSVLWFERALPVRGQLSWKPGDSRILFAPRLLLPGADGRTVRFEPVPPEEELTGEQADLQRDLLVVLEPGTESLSVVSYWGAKNLERLSKLPGDLAQTIALGGFLRILADPLLRGLHWIYEHAVPNYGWAIMLMTLALNIVLLPLTHKSYVSMRKMQELNPKIQALRARYRAKLKDKKGRPNVEAQRKMNEEMMALYKAEGVNPASGCLPILFQMPVFFAFFYILRSAVELRHAPWILWVQDLSAPEPLLLGFLRILPLLMLATQILQQRMTPMAGDPMQRRLFQLMPFFFVVILWGMPAGLVLYWTTNNVLNIVRQSVYNHLKSRASSPEGSPHKPPRGKSPKRTAAP